MLGVLSSCSKLKFHVTADERDLIIVLRLHRTYSLFTNIVPEATYNIFCVHEYWTSGYIQHILYSRILDPH